MGKYLLRRLAINVILVAIAASLAYMLAATTMNPRAAYEGRQPPVPEATIDATLDAYNLNDKTPVLTRYATWAKGVVTGDFGKTWNGGSVNQEMGRRVMVSLRLLLIGTLLGFALGVALGAFSAVKQYKLSDRLIGVTSFVIMAIPVFVLATLLAIATYNLNRGLGFTLIEYTGEYNPQLSGWDQFVNRLNHLILPTISLSLGSIAFYSRIQRNMMLDVLGQDFVRTAMAKGLRRRKALTKHALRTALIPSATYFAFAFGTMFTGATFTEKIFNWHGMGAWLVDSINQNDVNSVAAVTFFAAVCVLAAAFLSDLLVAALDPRVRVS
ncbi:Oligopeptide transport system permease protein OppB (TC 3.A.1.5.1) [[Actinomadura] parvosata subsp. kistnae]|uniref:Peptide ABC transporter permease n=1 Tax=[Actinomadura] parvosata subsp. kistnae TaxID=1909395 RepID=A0A1V0A543_9ACTN|nr:ABC transporter permease [Nonomuraea sp. ATCC 55076]AQZ65324.1 peptide ABC transporter permease [Nonomuraea sp. ATCC 55076]SPL96643.1 Oligopeptide transport system permease protein OppB (TC 3.A.1.5.1) [Actinomadura parvosata subsp. kistnae]